jgi:hypothetical protein
MPSVPAARIASLLVMKMVLALPSAKAAPGVPRGSNIRSRRLLAIDQYDVASPAASSQY